MVKKVWLPLLTTIVFGGIWFYFAIPAINPKHASFWSFLIALVVVFILSRLVFTFSLKGIVKKVQKGTTTSADGTVIEFKQKKGFKIAVWAVAVLLLAGIVIWLSSSELFNAKKYQQQLPVHTASFQDDIAEMPISQIPIVDKDVAQRLGNRKLGEVVELTSQFEVSTMYSQINYKNVPTRVSPLQYADLIKWFTNQSEGIPYYVTIDMATQETQLVKLEKPMKYGTCEYFNRNLERHIRFHYPTLMFEDPVFEIDDDGNPYWVVPTYDYKIGVLGGRDITGIVLVDAVSGETQRYKINEVPQWIDNVYPAHLIITQANNWGKYTNGFFNSVIGQRNVIRTTEGYNYLALDDDIWLYTGLTSVTSDKSNIGFILTNLRTKETRNYQINGAEENSAMDSAEGKVQEKKYQATFPILINVADQPTYFVSLKDDAGLVKQFAFVSVENYQVVGVGDTLQTAQESYIRQLKSIGKETEGVQNEQSGAVTEITSAVKDGNTNYYFRLDTGEEIYVASVQLSDQLPLLKVGDKVKISFTPDAKGMNQVSSFERVS